jgi:hypothetical protein
LALARAGSNIAARMAMMAITTSSSMRVKARRQVTRLAGAPESEQNDFVLIVMCFEIVSMEAEQLLQNKLRRKMTDQDARFGNILERTRFTMSIRKD